MKPRRIYYRKKLKSIIIEKKSEDGKTIFLKTLPKAEKLLEILKIFDKTRKKNEVYPKEFFEIRESIIKRDGGLCINCKSNEIVVHHIDHNTWNNESTNLITLCKQCHSSYHMLDALKKQNKISEKIKKASQKLASINEQKIGKSVQVEKASDDIEQTNNNKEPKVRPTFIKRTIRDSEKQTEKPSKEEVDALWEMTK